MKNKIKFSIIVPAYNIEEYIEKCIDSIKNQTYKNYEIIIINDGSTDNTKEILNKYNKDAKITIINQSNKGLSESRNIGVKNATGDYILFADGDDFIDKKLLEILNNAIKNEDLIRFQLQTIDENNNIIGKYHEKEFKMINGIEAFKFIVNYNYIEPACLYCYNRKYYIKNNYMFKKGLYHEDFGLIPLIIINAKTITSIDYIGYNYVQRKGSIMNNTDYKKEIKKAYDALEHYKYLKENNKNESKIFDSYIANNVILKSIYLKNKDYKEYLKLLRENKVFDNLLKDTIARKIKKTIVTISPKLYYKLLRGKK